MTSAVTSMAFPRGIIVEGATLRGGLTVNCEVKRLTLPGAALAVKTPGSLPPPSLVSYGAPARRAKGETRDEASHRFFAQDPGNPCYPSSHAMFRKSLNHNNEGFSL